MLPFVITIPMKLPSVANQRLHWAVKAKQAKAQRMASYLAIPRGLFTGSPLIITMTRIASRQLDSDNLASAFKAIRDGIAQRLGVDDGSSLLEWRVQQRTCKRGAEAIEIRIENLN